eukprot:jgi/Undpi1/10731/HiC_scaffold_29.g13179.m1
MEDVLRAQPDQHQQSRYTSSSRRRSTATPTPVGGGSTSTVSRHLQASTSFRIPPRRPGDMSTPPREDSPLLGTRAIRESENSNNNDEEKRERDPAAQAEHQRAMGAMMARDLEGGGGESPGGGSEGGRSRRTTASAAPTTLSAADEALLGTFMEVMSEGLPIKIHRSSGRARKTTMWLKDTDTLVWFSKRTVGGKRWHKLSLRGVTSVNAGKSSEPLTSKSAANADPRFCLTLGFPSLVLGLEGSSELERDALVQGFTMLIEDLKAADDPQQFRDPELGTRNI